MTLIRRPTPLTDLVSFQDAMERLFDERFFRPVWIGNGERLTAPALDLYTTPEAVIAKVALPGVKPEDVDVTIGDDVVTISGAFKEEKETTDAGYVHKELSQGKFSRTFALPTAIKADVAEPSSRTACSPSLSRRPRKSSRPTSRSRFPETSPTRILLGDQRRRSRLAWDLRPSRSAGTRTIPRTWRLRGGPNGHDRTPDGPSRSDVRPCRLTSDVARIVVKGQVIPMLTVRDMMTPLGGLRPTHRTPLKEVAQILVDNRDQRGSGRRRGRHASSAWSPRPTCWSRSRAAVRSVTGRSHALSASRGESRAQLVKLGAITAAEAMTVPGNHDHLGPIHPRSRRDHDGPPRQSPAGRGRRTARRHRQPGRSRARLCSI